MERKLTAILSADVKGYSRLMGEDEEGTIRTLTAYREVTDSLIQQHRGRIVGTAGDSVLAEFASAVDAVQCAVEIQHALKTRNAELPTARQMEFRIGINVGDVVVEGEQIYGDGVNVAARLQGLADAGGIFISGTIYDQIENKLALNYEYLGKQLVKNIAKPVRVYRVLLEPEAAASLERMSVLRQARPEQSRRAQHQRLGNQDPVTLSQSKPVLSEVEGGDQLVSEQPAHKKYGWKVTVAAVGLLLTVAAVMTVWRLRSSPLRTPQSALHNQKALPLPDKPSIAVLPFTNMSGDPEQESFSDGMTEDLITDLSKLSGLFVIARNSVFTYKGKAVQVKEVSQELGVRYVLEGSVRKADNRVRITAQLVDGTTGGHLWAKNYDRELTTRDIFALQDEITQQITAALQVEMLEAELDRVRRIPTDNLTAYDAVLRGKEHFFRFTQEANVQARRLFERAIALDPEYAEAYVVLGWTYVLERSWWSLDPQALDRALALAQKAVLLDESLPAAHSLLGMVYLGKKQPDLALAEGERAITLDPNDADAYAHQADTLTFLGRPAEAVELVEKAMRFDPHYPAWYLGPLGQAYRLTGRVEEAIATQKQALLRTPNFLPAYCDLAESYLAQWESLQTQDPQTLERALESAQKAVALSDSYPWAHIILARVYLSKRQHAQAIAEAERVIALVPNEADSYALLAVVLSYAGQPEKAIEVMEQALRLNPRPPAWYFFHLGRTYRLTGRVEEALATQQRALTQDPNFSEAYYELAVLYSKGGEEARAAREAATFRRRNPEVSLEVLKQVLPYKDPAETERVLAALRKAGLK